MDFISSFSDGPIPPLADVFKNVTTISRPVKDHLVRVYATLAAMMVLSSVGAYAKLHGWFMFDFGIITSLLSVGAIIGIKALPYNVQNNSSRWGLLWAFAFLQGISIGHIISFVLHVDPSGANVFTALVSASLIFACFTASAILAQRRSMLYIGGILASAISLLCWTSFMNIFIKSRAIWGAELYIGLLVFSGYVIFDTQLIIEKASIGNMDVVGHSIELFIDLVALFVRIMIILSKSRNDDDGRRDRRRNRRT